MDTADIKVTVDSLPFVTIPPPNPVLAGTDVPIEPIVSADVVSYDWSPPLYLNCTDCATPISTPLAPISYTLTVKTADWMYIIHHRKCQITLLAEWCVYGQCIQSEFRR